MDLNVGKLTAKEATKSIKKNRIIQDKLLLFYFTIICSLLLISFIGPSIVPYEASAYNYEDGKLLRTVAPSSDHLLGTNDKGQDVFSRLVIGARPTVITGILGGGLIITIGFTVGVTAGYLGGAYDDISMRIVDLAYGIPIIPFAIVLGAFMNFGFFSTIVIIGALLWRGPARTLRSQVLQIREENYIRAAKAMGASDFRVIAKHIFPNIAPMAVLFFALGVTYTIVVQAGLAFIGVANPFVPSWGVMLRNVYQSGYLTNALWWTLPPGIMISITVLSIFMFGRRYVKRQTDASEIPLTEG